MNTREANNSGRSEPVSTLLSCGHRKLLIVLPHILEKHYCVPCDMPRTVIVVEEWQVRCNVCRYSRFCGASKETVFTLAQKHFDETAHTCKYRNGRKHWLTICDETVTQGELEI